jgi:hypothetical protein
MGPIPAGNVDCGRENPALPTNDGIVVASRRSGISRCQMHLLISCRRRPQGSRNVFLLHLSMDCERGIAIEVNESNGDSGQQRPVAQSLATSQALPFEATDRRIAGDYMSSQKWCYCVGREGETIHHRIAMNLNPEAGNRTPGQTKSPQGRGREPVPRNGNGFRTIAADTIPASRLHLCFYRI